MQATEGPATVGMPETVSSSKATGMLAKARAQAAAGMPGTLL
jgi:hypothetical protein